MIVVVDCGLGNLGSIFNMLTHLHIDAKVSASLADIESADKLILPGVGSFDIGMRNLTDRGLVSILEDKVIRHRTPILGICLGMQLFSMRSEEGTLPGLGWIDGYVARFRHELADTDIRIPHVGWSHVSCCSDHPLSRGFNEKSRFYFVHSYHFVCTKRDDVLVMARYGYEFVAGVARDNIVGVQFHPEKSHKHGMEVLKAFNDFTV